MLFSVALILSLGMFAGWLCKKIHIPSLTGMLCIGILLGPSVLNLIDDSILNISPELRKIALIIILTRAGLSLDLQDLKQVGRPALLMCFVPACFEILGMVLLAPRLLHISVLDAAILGAVVGAVSPAVIVPKMLRLMHEAYGLEHHIPQLILTGVSVDDVFVIVMFTAFTGLAQGDAISIVRFIQIPISILLGILAGIGTGYALGKYFEKFPMQDTIKVTLMLCIFFLFVTLEDVLKDVLPFASLLAVMAVGIALQKKAKVTASRLSAKFDKLWIIAEILLFVLVGASLDMKYVLSAGGVSILLLLGVLVFRMVGVLVCLLRTRLTKKERLFCMIAYTPKATVQAAIGGIPLAMGLSCGNIVLTVAVAAILMTAPLGAFCIDITYKKLLTPTNPPS